ncbi:MAG: Hsp20/alpha crystallin family protein [Dehalococcoidia bacterium]|nr:MAG: Hsp20/alpha crystallin family protein [Dehalococcoidia bacterium]
MFRRPFGIYSFRSPWTEMERLQREMNRLFSDPFFMDGGRTAPSYPAMNVWTNEDGAVITAELPGVNTDDIDIAVTGDVLTLSGNRQPEELGEGDKYHRRERGYGRFTRTFQLPFQVESDQVEALFEKGVLHLSLPRAEADKPRKISIKTA